MNLVPKFKPCRKRQVRRWLDQNLVRQPRQRVWESSYWTPGDQILMTFRVMEHDSGFWIIVQEEYGPGVNLGTAATSHRIKVMFRALTKFSR